MSGAAPPRLAVLASGTGTLLDAIASELAVSLVMVDRECVAESVAERHGIPCERVQRTDFGTGFDRVGYTRAVLDRLSASRIDVVAMAGWGTILSPEAFDRVRFINTHPSLLPSFKGWHAVRDALDYGVKVTGCTVHVATAELDEGPILAQEAVAVLGDDTEAVLHERIKEVERRLYVDVLRTLMTGA